MATKPLIANHETNKIEELGSGVSLYGGTPIGGIVIWSGAVASPPDGFILCDGTAISRTDFATLFSIVGTTFGNGDGSTTFNIPNLRDKFIVGAGSSYAVGATGGSNEVTLTIAQIPSHDHPIQIRTGKDDDNFSFNQGFSSDAPNDGGTFDSNNTGGGQSHENRPPYVALGYIIRTI